jgi:hypothetical protein
MLPQNPHLDDKAMQLFVVELYSGGLFFVTTKCRFLLNSVVRSTTEALLTTPDQRQIHLEGHKQAGEATKMKCKIFINTGAYRNNFRNLLIKSTRQEFYIANQLI